MSKDAAGSLAWWAAIAGGALLVVFPEPTTTATGLAILTGALLLGDKG